MLCCFPLIITQPGWLKRGGVVVWGDVMCVRFRPLHMLKSHPGFENYKTNATPDGVEKGLHLVTLTSKMIARYSQMMLSRNWAMMLTLQKYPSNTIWRNLGCDPFHKLMNIFTIVKLKCKNEDVKYSLIHLFASQTVFSTKSDHKKHDSSPGVFWSVIMA